MGLKRIRRAVMEDRYKFSAHALEEADDDRLLLEDVRTALLSGNLVETLTDDPRGERFVIRGSSLVGDCMLEVVCRFLPSGMLRIITVYELEE